MSYRVFHFSPAPFLSSLCGSQRFRLTPFLLVALMATGVYGQGGEPESTTKTKPLSLQKTTIESETLEMRSTLEHNVFYFSGDVRVSGTNLSVNCRDLEVKSSRSGDPHAAIGEIGTIDLILATGDVIISQAGRTASAGRAEVFPKTGQVILTESPKIVQENAEVSGWRIVLFQGERRARIEQNPEGDERPTVLLDALPNLGFVKDEEGGDDKPTRLPEEAPRTDAEGEMTDPNQVPVRKSDELQPNE